MLEREWPDDVDNDGGETMINPGECIKLGSAMIEYGEVDDGCLACRSDGLVFVEAASVRLFGQEPLSELEVSIWLPVNYFL